VLRELEAVAAVLHHSRTQIVLDAPGDYFEHLAAKHRRRVRAALREAEWEGTMHDPHADETLPGPSGPYFLTVNRVIDACAGLPIDGRLEVLQMAWIVLAEHARNEALAIPGGFPNEQARQRGELEKITSLVRADTPDLEPERLRQEGDLAGHLRRLQGEA
jgi:hypothetical protein